MAKEQTIYTVINVIYCAAKLCGMAPYTTKSKKPGYTNTLTMNKSGFINLTVIVLVCSVMIYSFVQMIIIRQEDNFYNQNNTVIYVLYTLRLMSAIITILTFYFTQEHFIGAFEKLNEFDTKKKLYDKLQYTVYRNVTGFVILILLSFVIGIELVYYYVMEEKVTIIILDTLSNGLQLFIHLLALLYFELYVVILIDNFKFIKVTTEDLNNKFTSMKESQKKMYYVIKTISTMYDDLCKGAGLINHVFSFPLFSLVSLNFMEVLLGIYLITDSKSRNICSIYWTAFYGIQLFCILIPPGAVETQAKEISKYLAEAELQNDEDLLNERNHFLLRTLHQSVDFTACGFFPISTSAIIGQFSISISFLLFMFQIIK
ncbi:hypothetical protein FQR65_LT00387 [Abscondita terminalis]|nr:hypothetical protein FQR65_LT00387 [Abscondita terminalis]